mgnify:CR=1 FL=1
MVSKISDEITTFPPIPQVVLKGIPMKFDETKIMGILNYTDDSFFEGSRHSSEKSILLKAEKMLQEGADILDVGAYSSRPGAIEIPESVEIQKIESIIKSLRKEFPSAILSVDSFRSEVANAGINEGADLINDISGGDLDDKMFSVIAKHKVPYCIMHMRGTPQTMQNQTIYADIVSEIVRHFKVKIDRLNKLGIHDIILDPGIGFAKTVDQNFQLIKEIETFQQLRLPLLYGISRKSFIQKTLKIDSDQSLNGTSYLHNHLLEKNVSILRVHDVLELKQGIILQKQLR